MSTSAVTDRSRTGVVRPWLFAVAALVFVTLMVGGATRLTESGLSIVEWKPVTGVLPPTSEQGWQTEFDKYRAIPQYQAINRGMTLAQFKTIYWWEWTHRLLGRLIGAAFLLPFIYFLWRGWIARGERARLWAIFGLGAFQGAVGWWMVASGLVDRISVSPYRLSFHMTLACVIYAALIWTALRIGTRARPEAPSRLRGSAIALMGLVVAQIYSGALVAGLGAGKVYNTWPLIDSAVIPASESLWFLSPAWRNIFENDLTAQFIHRGLAYAVWLFALWHAYDAWRAWLSTRGAAMLALAVTLQAGLGIVTLLAVAPIHLALAHQFLAIVVLTVAVVHAERLNPQRFISPAGAVATQEAGL